MNKKWTPRRSTLHSASLDSPLPVASDNLSAVLLFDCRLLQRSYLSNYVIDMLFPKMTCEFKTNSFIICATAVEGETFAHVSNYYNLTRNELIGRKGAGGGQV